MKYLKIVKYGDNRYLKNYKILYENKVKQVKEYEMVSRNEIKCEEEIADKVNGISIVAFKDDKILLLNEFRMAVNRRVFNLCAGMIENGENAEECASRELYEETGLKIVRIVDELEPCFAAVAISDIRTKVIFAEVEGNISPSLSDNEDIVPGFYSREQVATMLKTENFSSRAQIVAYCFAKGFSFL